MRSRASGQAMPLGLAFIAVMAILVILLFNTSQLSGERARISNAADAAAYSGMVWQARTLNYQAYSNRAMVANQVAIAQVVSIANWSRYLHMASANIDFYGSLIPPAKPYTAAMLTAAYEIRLVGENIAAIAVPVMDVLLDILSLSQETMHYAAAATTATVVYDVVKANDPNYNLTPLAYVWLADNAKRWDDFTLRYDDEDSLKRKAGIIMASRDKFTEARDWQWSTLDLGLFKAQIVKRGSTRLQYNDGEWQWKARDTMSIHTRSWGCKGLSCKWRKKEIPIGWAQSTLSTDGSDIDSCKWCSWSTNKRAERLAQTMSLPIEAAYGGVRPYREIANLDESKPESRDPRLTLAVEVALNGKDIRTSSNIEGLGSKSGPSATPTGLGIGMFSMEEDYADTPVGEPEITAIAKAEVYFRRPVVRVNGKYGARDSQDEFGNLFNPYWDVRLTDATSERRLSWGARGVIYPEGTAADAILPKEAL